MSVSIRAAGWTMSRSFMTVAPVGDCLSAAAIDKEEVAAIGAQGRIHRVLHREAGVDVGYDLAFALGLIGAFFQHYDRRRLAAECCHLVVPGRSTAKGRMSVGSGGFSH